MGETKDFRVFLEYIFKGKMNKSCLESGGSGGIIQLENIGEI